jgi:hypothetical protein
MGSSVTGVILQDTSHFIGLQIFAGALLLAAATGTIIAWICKTGLVVSKAAYIYGAGA